ncbi:MAG: hypothetical protein JSS83_14835 [Cyanobacteria bacterium SZAS LIN-3]|nr:hypothetical protein [Cyanobacteria bacterium SZAS LIN-3]
MNINQIPTPDQIRESVIGKDSAIKIARLRLIAKATALKGKAFTFKQAEFGGEEVETALLQEAKNNGWTYDLVRDHSDGNYYFFRPLSR